MKSLWNENEAAKCNSDLLMRAYSSKLIGQEERLVLHGGGNTSVKSTEKDPFGNSMDVIWVKASGFDLAKMGPEGFSALDLNYLVRLGSLDILSDADMVNECLKSRLNASAAAPSIEAIVHALIPFKFVDHSHSDAIVTISNSKNGKANLEKIFSNRVLILPYVKPGFDLAKQFAKATQEHDFNKFEAVILEHHGVFTFADDAKTAYEKMISVVTEAEQWLENQFGKNELSEKSHLDTISIAKSRHTASKLAGKAVLSFSAGYIEPSMTKEIGSLLRNGTLTPEHVIHNKPFPAMLSDTGEGFEDFKKEYCDYFDRANDPNLTRLPLHPHWAIFETGHSRSYGVNLKRAKVSADVAKATLNASVYAQKIGGWKGLSEKEIRDIEYWDLEQSKLKRQKPDSVLTGTVAIVTGAASGIGLATAKELRANGSVVIGLDLNEKILTEMNQADFVGKVVDITDDEKVKQALDDIVQTFGGIDLLILNAGIFKSGQMIESLDDQDWHDSLEINLSSHMRILRQSIKFLRLGINPAVVFVASRNVPAPGPGASAYSTAKAALTQLMRIAALELATDGIRVNAIHPDAVFDTGIWTDEALENSAKRYGLNVEEYKTKNLLKVTITSKTVARAIVSFCDDTFQATIGAQLPVDGGNDRVI